MAQIKEQRRALARYAGVARVGPPAVAEYAAASDLANTVQGMAYKFGSVYLAREAELAAGQVPFNRNEEGRLEVPQMPEAGGVMGPTIYDEAYRNHLIQRYESESVIAINDKARELARNHPADPVAFDEQWDAWSSATLEASLPEAQAVVSESLSQVGSTYRNSVVSQRQEQDLQAVQQAYQQRFAIDMNNIRDVVGTDPTTAGMYTRNLYQSVSGALDAGIITTAQADQLRLEAQRAFYIGQIAHRVAAVPEGDSQELVRKQIIADAIEGKSEVTAYTFEDGKLNVEGTQPIGALIPKEEVAERMRTISSMVTMQANIYNLRDAYHREQSMNAALTTGMEIVSNGVNGGQTFSEAMAGVDVSRLKPQDRYALLRQLNTLYNTAVVRHANEAQNSQSAFYVEHQARWLQREMEANPQAVEAAGIDQGVFNQRIIDAASNPNPQQAESDIREITTMISTAVGSRKKPTRELKTAIKWGEWDARNTAIFNEENSRISDPERSRSIANTYAPHPVPPTNAEERSGVEMFLRGKGVPFPENMVDLPPHVAALTVDEMHGTVLPVLENYIGPRLNRTTWDLSAAPEDFQRFTQVIDAVFSDPGMADTFSKVFGDDGYDRAQIYRAHYRAHGAVPTDQLMATLEAHMKGELQPRNNAAVRAVDAYLSDPDLDDIRSDALISKEYSAKAEDLLEQASGNAVLMNDVIRTAKARIPYNNNNAADAILESLHLVSRDYTLSEAGFSSMSYLDDPTNRKWYRQDRAHYVRNQDALEWWYGDMGPNVKAVLYNEIEKQLKPAWEQLGAAGKRAERPIPGVNYFLQYVDERPYFEDVIVSPPADAHALDRAPVFKVMIHSAMNDMPGRLVGNVLHDEDGKPVLLDLNDVYFNALHEEAERHQYRRLPWYKPAPLTPAQRRAARGAPDNP